MKDSWESFKSEMIAELNRLREEPSTYGVSLNESLCSVKENKLLCKDKKQWIRLKEGKEAIEEAIECLDKQRSLSPLTYDESLEASAEEHANYLSKRRIFTEESSLSLTKRVEKYCEWESALAESVDFGSPTAEDVVVALVVNDGVEKRGDRCNLLSTELKYVGIGVRTHETFGKVVVLDFAGGVREKGTPYYDYDKFKYQYPTDFEQKKEKIKTPLQLKDKDAPDNAISCRIEKNVSLLKNNKVRKVEKKIYELEDGTYKIVEIEEV